MQGKIQTPYQSSLLSPAASPPAPPHAHSKLRTYRLSQAPLSLHQVFTLALSPPQPLPQLHPYASFGTWLSYCILQEVSSDLQSQRWMPKSCAFIVACASLSQFLSHCNLINSSLVFNRFQMLAPRTCTVIICSPFHPQCLHVVDNKQLRTANITFAFSSNSKLCQSPLKCGKYIQKSK